jgi:hypothetical protein
VIVIECPDCRRPIQLMDLRPGRFIPKCPHCGIDFELTIPEDVAQPPEVEKLDKTHDSIVQFTKLTFPESPVEPPIREAGGFLGDIKGRLLERLRSLRITRLPRGVPRLLDEGRSLVLRREGQGPYGPLFVAAPWCGGSLRTVWMLPPDRGRDPYHASRWVGEMIIAAELVHPNLEPFVGTGRSRGLFHAARPRAEEASASTLIRAAESPEDREKMAAAIILQVARGLKFAHDQGSCHRDIRPENVVVDRQGCVKLINFGLDSRPFVCDAERQRQAAAIADKRNVKGGWTSLPPIDRREELETDLAGLGRTFAALALDQPEATSMPVDSLRTRIGTMDQPAADISRKLIEPSPEDRFNDMGEVVRAFESLLGVWSPAALGEREPFQGMVREAGDQLQAASGLTLRRFILRIAAGFWIALLALCGFAGLWKLGLNFVVLGALTAAWIGAVADPSLKRRSGLIGLLSDWLQGTSFLVPAAVLLVVLLIAAFGFLTGRLGSWIAFGLISFGLALALEVGVGRRAGAEWRSAFEPLARRIADLRFSGFRDELLREWFDSARAPNVRGLRQSLFPTSKLREIAGDAPAAAESIVQSGLSAVRRLLIERARRDRDRHHQSLLTSVETDRLVARGINQLTAVRRARRAGKAVMTVIGEWRLTRLWDSATMLSLRPDRKKTLRENVWQAVDDPERMLIEQERHPSRLMRRASSIVQTAMGRLVRLAVGAAMFVLFGIWLDREEIVTRSHVAQASADASRAVGRAITNQDVGELREVRIPVPSDRGRLWEAWNEPMISREWSRSLSGINLGVAGLVLVLSAFFERFTIGLFAILGASVILIGPVLAQAELGGSITHNTSASWLIAGAVVAMLGYVVRLKRRTD